MNMSGKGILVFKIVQIIVCIICQTKSQLEEIPCGAAYLPKNCENASVETLDIVEDYERCAPARLDPFVRDYVWGAAGRQTTLYQNKEAFTRIWLKKRVLQGNAKHSLETTVFGRRIGIPLGIAPTVGHSIFHPEGEKGTARGAARAGAIIILNGYSLTSLEEVAASVPPNTELWIQTYIFPKREVTLHLVQRAERAGYKAIVVTLDEPFDTDIRCKSRTEFFKIYVDRKSPNIEFTLNSNDVGIDETLNFQDITWLAGHTKLPIIAKGFMTAEDAVRAVEAGASAIYVSNQGGRELEWCLPTIDALPSVVRAVQRLYPWVDVFVDGGIRSGHDIFKALARGAKAAFIGRPAVWGLVMGGEKGVNAVANILKQEFKEAMIHAGFENPSLISNSSIISKWIYSDFY